MKIIKPEDLNSLYHQFIDSEHLTPEHTAILLACTEEAAVLYTQHKNRVRVKYAGNADMFKTVNEKSIISILATDSSEYFIMVADGRNPDSYVENYLLFLPKKEKEEIPCFSMLLYGKPGRAKVHFKLISTNGKSYSHKLDSVDYMWVPQSSCEYALIKWGLKIPWNKFEDRWFGSLKYKEDYYV